jgi:phytoene synthase
MSDSHFRAADAVLSAKGRSFHWARRFLGERHAERATRLYMLCRYVDDIADEADSGPAALQALAKMKQDIGSGRSTDPIVADGMRLFAECGIEPGIFIELIDGVESDLGTVRIADTDALIHYCYQVAGTVGLMMCRILDAKEAAADAHAIDLGIAMQLTNICRDVVADATLDRRYLPATLVGELAPAALLQPDTGTDAAVRSALSDLLQLADRYYQSGESGLAYLPVASRAGILLAARVYHAIGSTLRRNDFCFQSGRAVVGTGRKSLITLQTLAEFVLHRRYWQVPAAHDAALHEPLRRTSLRMTTLNARHVD